MEGETDYQALKRILAPVLKRVEDIRSEGLLCYVFPDPEPPESRGDEPDEARLSFCCGPDGRLDIVAIQRYKGTAAYQRPGDGQ